MMVGIMHISVSIEVTLMVLDIIWMVDINFEGQSKVKISTTNFLTSILVS